MSWSKVSERRWERPIDGIKGYFVLTESMSAAACEGRQHYTVFARALVELNVPDDNAESALKQAWIQLRHEQPHIATTVEGTTKIYEIPDEAALQAWLTATFVVSGAADAEALWDTVSPITQTTLCYLPKSSELVLRAHHYVVDGVGLLMLMDRYLNALANPAIGSITFGDEVTRLAPPLAEALGVSEQPAPEQTERVKSIIKGYAEKVPSLGPVSRVNRAPAGNCRNTRLTFSQQTIEAIIQACKEKNITVTSAVHAAYIQTLTGLADPSIPSPHYVTQVPFDLRKYLPKPYDSAQYAAAVWYSSLPFHLDLPASFWDTVRALNEFYRTSFRDDPALRLMTPHYNRSLEILAGSEEYQNAPIPHDALPSSLGAIERYVQRVYGSAVTVRDLMVGLDVVLGLSVFFISTFREKLQVVYSFNDGYEEPADIDRYLESIRTVLVEELLVS
ncbi:hypothetical protein BDW72DRAFT_202432 [Aspergillus terricola var. indicus]